MFRIEYPSKLPVDEDQADLMPNYPSDSDKGTFREIPEGGCLIEPHQNGTFIILEPKYGHLVVRALGVYGQGCDYSVDKLKEVYGAAKVIEDDHANERAIARIASGGMRDTEGHPQNRD